MSERLRSVSELEAAEIDFHVRTYDYGRDGAVYPDDLDEDRKESVVKTLILRTERGPVCAIIPYGRLLHMGKLGKLSGSKRISLFPSDQLESTIGYVIGSISPLGMLIRIPTFFDSSLKRFDYIHVNGGMKGAQIAIPVGPVVRHFQWREGSIVKDESTA